MAQLKNTRRVRAITQMPQRIDEQHETDAIAEKPDQPNQHRGRKLRQLSANHDAAREVRARRSDRFGANCPTLAVPAGDLLYWVHECSWAAMPTPTDADIIVIGPRENRVCGRFSCLAQVA